MQDCHGNSSIQQEEDFSLADLKKKLVKCYIWSIALYGAGTWTLWKVDQKYLESFKNVVLKKDGEEH
jgi:hypothetical protein